MRKFLFLFFALAAFSFGAPVLADDGEDASSDEHPWPDAAQSTYSQNAHGGVYRYLDYRPTEHKFLWLLAGPDYHFTSARRIFHSDADYFKSISATPVFVSPAP